MEQIDLAGHKTSIVSEYRHLKFAEKSHPAEAGDDGLTIARSTG